MTRWSPKFDKDSVKATGKSLLHRFVPVSVWGPRLTKASARDDLIGGFIAGVMTVPTCLSWASLAGLPLSCGLSAALVACFAYGTMGQCPVILLCPVAEITTLLISIPGIAPEDREAMFQSLGVQVGILSVILSFIDGGKVIKTVFAKAVGDGYTCAAALLAISVQVKVMFNVTAPPATLIQDVIITTVRALRDQMTTKSIYCFVLFMVYCLYLIYIKKTKLPLWIPHQLIVVVVSTFVTWFFRLDQRLGLTIVQDLPSGLSLPSFPPLTSIIGLGPYTLTITMISFVQIYVIAQRVMPDIDPNAELFAGGVTNFLCNIFSGMPVTNSFSCSSVLMEQHVHSPLTSYTAGTVVLITVVFLTRLGVFYYLPKQALAAIVVASVFKLLDFSGPTQLWKYSKKDAAVWILTFLLTIFGGITVGVLSGIMLSLVLVVLRIARPRAVSVGFNMTTFRYGDLSKDPELLVYPNILMWRFDAPLYFVNTGYFQEKLTRALEKEVRPIDVVVVTCGKVVDIDAAALASLPTILQTLSKNDGPHPRRIILTDIHGRLEQVLLESEALPIYVPEEFDRLSISQIEQNGKFPVVFKKLEEAITFAQRCISERYGNVDTAPYPSVSFLTDIVVEAARLQEASGASSLAEVLNRSAQLGSLPLDGTTSSSGGGGRDDVVVLETSFNETLRLETMSGTNSTLLHCLEKLRKMSTFTPDRELIGVMGVVRNTEVTPKQKKKVVVTHPTLLQLAFDGTAPITRKSRRSPEELREFFQTVEQLLPTGALGRDGEEESWRRVLTIVRSNPQGLKMQLKPMLGSASGSFIDYAAGFASDSSYSSPTSVSSALLVVKWGGVLTKSGIGQAHVLGEKLFARFFAAGDLPLTRLVNFTRHPTVVAADENRIINTALVVINALTQGRKITKKDIQLDDTIMKTLTPTTKLLLQHEFRYYEALMHIDTHAAARHFFHIPGFRQLIVIPPLDRPLNHLGSLADELGANDFTSETDALLGEDGKEELRDINHAFSMRADAGLRGAFASGTMLGAHPSAGVGRHLNECLQNDDDFYTPFQVMEDLERQLHTLIETDLPKRVLDVPLSNHETLRELRGRYETLLNNLLGAKRRRRRGRPRSAAAGAGLMEDSASPGDALGERTNTDHFSDFSSDEEHQSDPVMEELQLEVSPLAPTPTTTTTTAAGVVQAASSSSTSAPGSSVRRRHKDAGGASSNVEVRAIPIQSLPQPLSSPSVSLKAGGGGRAASPHAIPQLMDTNEKESKYDTSDVTTLRDYGSYDMAYNYPVLNGLLMITHLTELRHVMEALQRITKIGECMARVGENVLEGVNSSKRFIIGSLVSGGLLERINNDFHDFAHIDEARGVKELLYRAQQFYLAENSGVEQDVRSMVKLVQRIGRSPSTASPTWSGARGGVWEDRPKETEAERQFRLKFPFISLPKETPTAAAATTGESSGASRFFRDSEPSFTRFYFTSYLHVEGVQHCLFESSTVPGFYRPSKEEMETSQQLYMKHIIFKVFRRRNVSFTDSEILAGFRKLNLLFRSDVDYDRQQRELRAGLASLYHAVYYVSMEVYLSMGDAEGNADNDALLFTVHDSLITDAEATAGYDSDTNGAATGKGNREGKVGRSGSHSRSPPPYSQGSTVAEDARVGTDENEDEEGTESLSERLEGTYSGSGSPFSAASFSGFHGPLGGTVGGGGDGGRAGSPSGESAGTCSPGAALTTAANAAITHVTFTLPEDELPQDGAAPAATVAPAAGRPTMRKRHRKHARAATVMTTPQAGRRTEQVQQMRKRVSHVTPMWRVHEGIGLGEFSNLIKEVESAVHSQTSKT